MAPDADRFLYARNEPFLPDQMKPSGRKQFFELVCDAVREGSLEKLTLGKPTGKDPTLVNLFVRPVTLKSGPRFSFVWRHATRDITKNHDAEGALIMLEPMIGSDFLDAHLFTPSLNAQLETGSGEDRIRLKTLKRSPVAPTGNDRLKKRAIPSDAPWLRALGVTDAGGKPLAAMTDKFRQIEKFSEILGHLLMEAPLPTDRQLRVFDMGCGKGYLTFAASTLLGDRANVCGIEARPDLVDFCSRTASEMGMAKRLSFRTGSISDTDIGSVDVLVALHACDTATDDALAKGISAGAALLVVSPCCQKEVRPQIVAPPVLAAALRHGIFEERQAEFATDALRAQLLEWSGYRSRVIEFISTEHTSKNTMITAVKSSAGKDDSVAARIREFAAFYGIRRQSLASQLGFELR
ncbi:MAG TPA: SAM-dependent methyltransferase [Opitutaceae bacterium]